jgi:hypothetical protein
MKEPFMSRYKTLLVVCLIVFSLAFAVFLPAASAQSLTTPASSSKPDSPDPSDQGWHVAFTPYIWFSGIHGTVGALGHEASVHASFGDIFNYLNIGLMGAVEPRYNRIVMPVDFMWMKLSDNKSLPFREEALSVKATMNEVILTPKIGYRFIDTEKFKVDALFGIRYWHMGTTLKLQGSKLSTNSFSDSANWVDGLGGAQIQAALTPKVVVTILGDAGGGSAVSDYQVGGFLGYRISKRWIMQAGYRYLAVNYRPGGKAQFINDTEMSGLLLGATWNIK